MRRLRQLNAFIAVLGIATGFALSAVYALNYRGSGDLALPVAIAIMAVGLLVAARAARSDARSRSRDIQ